MVAAARGDAGGRQAALAAKCKTDPGTLARVAEALRGQLDGQVIPAAPILIGPPEPLEHRTCTVLAPLYAKRHR
jgi:hypothetical protein